LLALPTLMCFGCTVHMTFSRTHEVEVKAAPPEAEIWLRNQAGMRVVGKGEATVEQSYTKHWDGPNYWLFLVPGVLTAAGVPMFVSGLENTNDSGMAFGGAVCLVGALLTGILFAIGVLGQDKKTWTEGQWGTVGARAPGYQESSAKISLESDEMFLELTRLPGGEPTEDPAGKPARMLAPDLAPTPKPKPRKKRRASILAVFAIEDPNRQFKQSMLDQLTDYLETVLTQSGAYKVVPRAQLRRRLVGKKKGSYRQCFDQACQIELGKAVSAQMTLSAKLLRVGGKCALIARIYDLRTETAVKAASTRTRCAADALMLAVDKLAGQLTK